MSRSVLDRLKDIVDSADFAVQHAGGLDAGTLAISDQRRDAALFRIAVIGEAASHIPAEVQTLSPDVPWMRVKNMRNHIIHGYWQIDFRIVAETIALDLGPIKATARRLIELIGPTET
jgi:uncharacterized protein with HEPN domain